MAFVPGYRHDIFISYAHVDDQPVPGANEGWVTTLVKGLRTLLGQKLGRKEFYSLWIDPQLAGNVPITPEIMEALRSSATLLIILSPGYLTSEWCVREKNTFLNTIKERVRSGSRMFIVERDKVEDNERPPEVKDLRGYCLWVEDREGKPPRILGVPKPNPDDVRYYDLLNDLSHDLVKELHRLKAAAETPTTETQAPARETEVPDTRPTIFLAEVTDDLDPQRDDVKRYLDQGGLRVLPDTSYSLDPTAFQKALDSDLARCALFVQLLSGVPGKRPPGLTQGYARLQYERAVEVGKPILQWRGPDFDVTTIRDVNDRSLLELDTVLAVGIEEFKREVVQRAQHKPSEPGTKRNDGPNLVFVVVEEGDMPLAEDVCKALKVAGVGHTLPLWCLERNLVEPEKVRKDFEDSLLECDGLIVIYGRIEVTWVRGQLRNWRKIAPKRGQPLRALAVCEGPPPELPEPKPALRYDLPNMQIINWRDPHHQEQIEDFVKAVKTVSNS